MAKFGRKNVNFRLSVPAHNAPQRTLRNLLRRVDKRDALNFSGLAVIEDSQLHENVLRAEYQKTLGFYARARTLV
jgi:hypothetical protein